MIDRRDLFTNEAGTKFRLLDTTKVAARDRDGRSLSIAHVFCMDEPNAMPKQWLLQDLLDGLSEGGGYKKLQSRGMAVVVSPNLVADAKKSKSTPNRAGDAEDIDPSLRVQRERWAIIAPLVGDERIYWRKHRGQLVAKRAIEANCSENTVNAALRLYWRGGMTEDALRGAYDKSGIPKNPSAKPRAPAGRPPRNARYQIFRWPEDGVLKRKVIALGLSLIRKNRRTTQRVIYVKAISKLFSVVREDGRKYQLPLGSRPTREQVYTLIYSNRTLEARLRQVHGDDDFENNVEEKTGSARAYADTIAQYFEIDATIVDVWICADDDPSVVIGKATLYLIIDVFSRLIVGFHLTLDKPSWAGAMEAMLTLAEDKRELCARWEHPYTAETWVGHGAWPQFFRGDKGSDVAGYDSDSIVEGLEGGFINLKARKAPGKGTVEVSFKLVQMPLGDNVGGHTPSSEIGKRQTDDYKGEATRTFKSVAQEILSAVDYNNTKVHRRIRLPAGDVRNGHRAVPSEIWKREYENNSGGISRFDKDFLMFKLLPNAQFTVTSAGVFRQGLLWEPDSQALRKQWLLPASQGVYKVRATYDRRRTDVIYVHDSKDPTKWTTMELTDRSADYRGMSWKEYEDCEDARLTLDELAEEHNLALEIRMDDASSAREVAARKVVKKALNEAGGKSRTNGAVQMRANQAKKARGQIRTLPTTSVPVASNAAPAARQFAQAAPANSNDGAGSSATPLKRVPGSSGLAALLKLKKT